MLKQTYKHLNRIQKGSFGESYAKMAFTLEGFEVYTSDYDDRGVDFVARSSRGTFYHVQVKTTLPNANPFIYESKFHPTDDFLFVAVRLAEESEPRIYVAKGSEWEKPCECFHYNSEGGDAGAYYELRFSKMYEERLNKLLFEHYVPDLQ